jgi:hypothetical protein
VKYFFLAEGWQIGRVWASEGLWQEMAWRRLPDIQRLDICLKSQQEIWWLYRVEAAVLTVEVKRDLASGEPANKLGIGQVVLKRLMSAEQVLERLSTAEAICHLASIPAVDQ